MCLLWWAAMCQVMLFGTLMQRDGSMRQADRRAQTGRQRGEW